MKIITVNLPVSYLKMIDGLVGNAALYPSRSELIRVAVRDFLIRELESAKNFGSYTNPAAPIIPTPEFDPNLFVQIPLGSTSNGVPEFKTFRLKKKDNSVNNEDNTPKLKPIEEPIPSHPHVPQVLEEPELINIGGKIMRVIKR